MWIIILKTIIKIWDAYTYYIILTFLHIKSTLLKMIYFYPVQYSYIKLTGFIDHFTKRSLLVRYYIPIFFKSPPVITPWWDVSVVGEGNTVQIWNYTYRTTTVQNQLLSLSVVPFRFGLFYLEVIIYTFFILFRINYALFIHVNYIDTNIHTEYYFISYYY